MSVSPNSGKCQEEDRVWTLKALTDIWTGDSEGKGERLILTGLLGSLRWWFEVLVRGLGGWACDPTQDRIRCPNKEVTEPTAWGHHCVVCELFGCTGWARKFRFQVLNADGKVKTCQIKAEQEFKLQFIPLRPIRDEEWALLTLTIRLIADYGAIGGRTVLKPSDQTSSSKANYHRDYGLVGLVQEPCTLKQIERETLNKYVSSEQWRKGGSDDFAWASLKNFWCVKGRYLARRSDDQSTFNRVIGREEQKECARQEPNDGIARWLAGGRRESKKVFSFKDPACARRTFGFVKPGLLRPEKMKDRLRKAWSDLKDEEFQIGDAIIDSIFKSHMGNK